MKYFALLVIALLAFTVVGCASTTENTVEQAQQPIPQATQETVDELQLITDEQTDIGEMI